MLKGPFWTSCKDLLRYKATIAGALAATIVAAICFGAGLSMILPVFMLFFNDRSANQPGVNPLAEFLLNIAATPWLPQPIANFFTQLAQLVPQDELAAFILIMLVIYALSAVANLMRYIQQLLISRIAERQAAGYRDNLYAELIEAPTEHFMHKGASDLASKIWIDVRILSNAQVSVFGKGVAEFFRGMGALGFALLIDPVLVLVSLISAPPAAILIQKFGTRIRRGSRGALDLFGRAMEHLNASLSSLTTIKISNAEGYERRRFRSLNREIYHQMMVIRDARAMTSPAVEMVTMLGVIIAASFAAWYIIYRGADPATSIVTLGMLAAAAASLKPVTQLVNVIRQAEPAAQRVLDSLNLETEATRFADTNHLPALTRHHQSIAFENIQYHYPEADADVLNDINLTVPAGTTCAIVGGNGAGKSTLISLIPRLISPAQGRILIDGNDIATVSLRSLRKQIAYVTQKTLLFQGTIADNIAYGTGHLPRQAIIAAAEAALADEFIESLPLGYDTRLGEAGSGLSGGQAQRIAIARAILRNPAILILDEATSQIDTESETQITQAIEQFASERTTFVIAHRMSTVINADQIVVMDQGHITDIGTHHELLDRCRIYQNLTQTQLKQSDT